ncbi:MAG: VacJ family lipoprotein [Bdellovibrionales bacterium RIFOXYB2_FULL_36_6]|nr:MAG: VacJ family lipoprotein [Bdellovibrionales bacterium RIFOXYB2_FULL_36_6]OGR27712.1 MAG: VacJ family lipoprotein [Desulfobacterales bacterium RIFOXYA12_FULL_46_15]
MGKKYFFLIVVVFIFVFIVHIDLFAQDFNTVTPLLSEDSFSLCSNSTQIFLAQNTQAKQEENGLGDEIFADYQDPGISYQVFDPLYYFNYAMYSLNDMLYFALLKPIATGYKTITPIIIRKGVHNFFYNLLFPVRFVNNLLQGEIKDAGMEIEVFCINTTIGVLGFGRVAQDEFELKTNDEDLGQTFGSYSIGNGFYLVLPVLGPSTLRDVLGLAGDYFLKPVNYVDPWELSFGINAYDTINSLSFHLGDYEAIKAAAIDPYVAIKNAYIQNREKKIKE